MGTVIRAGEAGSIMRQLTTVDLADHLAEADSVVEAAKRQAQQTVERAKRSAALAMLEAKKRGYEAGYKEGLAAGQVQGHAEAHKESTEKFNSEHSSIVSDMERVIEEFDSIKRDLRIAAEHDLIDFAVKVATKLTFEIGSVHRESAIENLRKSLDLVADKTNLTVRVHPDDVESVGRFADSVLKRLDSSANCTLIEDDSFSPGGCVLRSEKTEVDSTLETQIAEIVSVLLGGEVADG